MKKIRKVSLLIYSFSLLLFSCHKDKEAIELTLMTYNIYHGESRYHSGESNLEGVAAVINKYQPDFVALQEVDSMTQRTASFNGGERKDLVRELAKLTDMHGYFGKAIDYDGGGYGEGLLSRTSLEVEVKQLPAPMGGEGRAVAYVRYEYGSGKELIFAGTHLCHEHEENRKAQVEDLNALFGGKHIPVILAGDLNFTDSSKTYKLFEEQWIDAAIAYGEPKNTIPFPDPKSRIDYVLLSKQADWEILDVEVVPVSYSDHMPVIVKVRLYQ